MVDSASAAEVRRLRDSDRFFDLAGDYLVVFGFDFQIRRVNAAVYRGLATNETAVSRRHIGSFIHRDDRLEALDAVEAARKEGSSSWIGRCIADDGSAHRVRATLVHDVEEDTIVLVGRDVTAEYELNRRLKQKAETDRLTGLWNRERILAELAVRQERKGLAVLFCDLDRFKVVNDSLGHTAGDALLRVLGERLRSLADRRDVAIGRIGGDEFVALVNDVDLTGALELADDLRALVADPLRANGKQMFVGMSVGIALSGHHGLSDGEALLGAADTAVYRAKAAGRNRAVVYDAALRQRAEDRYAAEADLRAALAEGRLAAYAQPLVRLSAPEDIRGAELLVRMEMPDGSVRPPGWFLPVAEETGLIVDVDNRMLELALGMYADLCPGLSLGINVSATQLVDPGFARSVIQMAERYGQGLDDLVIELTESSVITDPEVTSKNLETLRRHGVRIALDDFGTGYSSLAHLSTLPIDVVKIDRAFTAEVVADAGARAVVEAIVSMGEGLGLVVIAEGVETEAEAEVLHSLGCEHVQGWLYHRPMPIADLVALRSRQLSAGAV